MTSDIERKIEKKLAVKITKKRRFGLVLLFMAIFAVMFQVGSMTPVDSETAKKMMEEFENAIKNIDAFGIFAHNVIISLMMFLAGFGIAWGMFTGFQTGLAYSAASTIEPTLRQVPSLILFITPFGIMELFAYGIAMSRSYLLVRHAFKRTIILKPLVIEVGIVIALLLVGGYIEQFMIQWAIDSGFDLREMLK